MSTITIHGRTLRVSEALEAGLIRYTGRRDKDGNRMYERVSGTQDVHVAKPLPTEAGAGTTQPPRHAR